VENKEGFEAFSKSSAVKPASPCTKDKEEAGPSNRKKHSHGPRNDWSLVSEENHDKVNMVCKDLIFLCVISDSLKLTYF